MILEPEPGRESRGIMIDAAVIEPSVRRYKQAKPVARSGSFPLYSLAALARAGPANHVGRTSLRLGHRHIHERLSSRRIGNGYAAVRSPGISTTVHSLSAARGVPAPLLLLQLHHHQPNSSDQINTALAQKMQVVCNWCTRSVPLQDAPLRRPIGVAAKVDGLFEQSFKEYSVYSSLAQEVRKP